MESLEQRLFQADNRKNKAGGTEKIISHNKNTQSDDTTKKDISEQDRRMLRIISAYIKKLPDNHTRKQLARHMINIIMKSANL